MQVQFSMILAVIVGIMILFIAGRLVVIPMKYVVKLVYSAIMGGFVLFLINFIGEKFNFQIAFNVVTAMMVGLLGIPGVVLLVVLKYIV